MSNLVSNVHFRDTHEDSVEFSFAIGWVKRYCDLQNDHIGCSSETEIKMATKVSDGKFKQ